MSELFISGDPINGNVLRYEPRAACLIKSMARAKYAGMFEPVLTRLRTHMRTELGDQGFAKCGEPAFAEHLPYLGIRKALECRDFQFQKMILIRVEIDSMYASWACLIEIVQHVVSSRGYAKNGIVAADVEEAMVDSGVFPGEGINVLVVELGMLFEGVIVVDASLIVLVEH